MKNNVGTIILTLNENKEFSFLQETKDAANLMKTTGDISQMLGVIDVSHCSSLVTSVKKQGNNAVITIDLLKE